MRCYSKRIFCCSNALISGQSESMMLNRTELRLRPSGMMRSCRTIRSLCTLLKPLESRPALRFQYPVNNAVDYLFFYSMVAVRSQGAQSSWVRCVPPLTVRTVVGAWRIDCAIDCAMEGGATLHLSSAIETTSEGTRTSSGCASKTVS